jgi:molecular chaperone GrpE
MIVCGSERFLQQMTEKIKKTIRPGIEDKHGIPVTVEVQKEMDDIEQVRIGEGKEKDREITEFRDQLQRLKADFDNYRKRIQKESESTRVRSKGELILNLLPVLDDLERMIQHHESDGQCSLQGIRMIYENFKKVLRDEGLEEIEAVGRTFDPGIHDAVGVEKTGADRDGLVVEEWQRGYSFNGTMLRPSRVKVGKAYQESDDG